jgi:hypothetical protein
MRARLVHAGTRPGAPQRLQKQAAALRHGWAGDLPTRRLGQNQDVAQVISSDCKG